MSSIIQKFDLVRCDHLPTCVPVTDALINVQAMADPSYNLELKQALTIKPNGFSIRAIPRAGRRNVLAARSFDLKSPQNVDLSKSDVMTPGQNDTLKQRLYVLYGSNTGTSESFAQRIASEAPAHGFRATLGTLDSATERIPTDGPVIIVTASFEGKRRITHKTITQNIVVFF